ncbi:MAG TPA: lasso peptide biosynthesis B2 protein, partial [Gemmatimonadaceae bacterium]|nr:lasso peptide biosynthesis B2 protein [Gemmatimonadaceae bacterium]
SDIETLLETLTPRAAPRAHCSLAWRDRVVCEVLRGARLFPRNRDGDCLLRSLALYHALRRLGWPARFVSGVRREGGVVRGHAWVELDGRVLTELYESANRQCYSVLVEYPRAEGDREQGAEHAAQASSSTSGPGPMGSCTASTRCTSVPIARAT